MRDVVCNCHSCVTPYNYDTKNDKNSQLNFKKKKNALSKALD